MGSFYLRQRARDDLKEIAAIIESDRPEAARRFLVLAIQSMESLADQPNMGRKCGFKTPATELIRKHLVKPG